MKSQTIARLESLLSRVRLRAAEPRVRAVAAVSAAAAGAPAPAAVHLTPAPARAPEPPPAPAAILDLDEPAEDLESTQSRHVPSRPMRAKTEVDVVVEVEVDVQASTQEAVIAVPVEEAPIPAALDSRERLVVAERASGDAPAGEMGASSEPEVIQVTSEEVVEIDEAPASSRRPVAPPPEQRLEEMAFGTVEPQPPRHTPPPESGRLPAAPAPEGEFDGDITGVREAKAGPPPAIEIVPEATIADLGPGDDVADLAGAPRATAPTTFLAVLDASLAL